MSADDLLVVAGEASGDLHAARLLSELRRLRPALRAFGFGGDELRAAGLEAVSEEDIAVVGIFEVLRVLGRARTVFDRLLDEVDRRRPAAAVLVDFPEFNLRLAAQLERRGVRVVYYISPQIWAWRRYRVHQIAQRVDKMLVLFSFEREFYREHGVEARHVGHPLVDEVPELPHAWDEDRAEGEPYRLALLPGSRPNEVEKLLPVMLEAAAKIDAELPLEVRLVRAPRISPSLLEPHLGRTSLAIETVSQRRFEVVADSHLALCASGTATLETGLLGTPQIVLYRLSRWSYALARLLVKIPYFSLVNLVLERGVVPELIQRRASPDEVARLAVELLGDRAAIARMRSGLADLRHRLGDHGASARAARHVAETIEEAT